MIREVTRKRLMVFAGSASCELGKEVAKAIGLTMGEAEIEKFSNGEIYVRILENVRGGDAFVIQTGMEPINDNLMELLIMIDALKRASAKRITAVMPYYPYSRQDKKALAREPITARLVADLLGSAGADRVLSFDLHAGQIQGFFNFPLDHVTALPILASEIAKKGLRNTVVVSPDAGRVKVAKRFSDILGYPMAMMHKRRTGKNVAEIVNVIGEVEDRNCILIDDMIDTAGTMVEAVAALKERGACDIFAVATHPILSGPAIERISNSELKEVIVTNTLPVPQERNIDKITVLSVAPLLANTITAVFKEESVSEIVGTDF